jgi:hypothetical protein
MSSLPLHWLSLALVCLSAPAQDPWVSVTQAVAGARSPDSFVLVATDPGFGFQWFMEDALGATYGKELILMTPAKDVVDNLVRDKGGQCWALFDPSGQMLDEGRGLPRPAAIRERMLQAGWRPFQYHVRTRLRMAAVGFTHPYARVIPLEGKKVRRRPRLRGEVKSALQEMLVVKTQQIEEHKKIKPAPMAKPTAKLSPEQGQASALLEGISSQLKALEGTSSTATTCWSRIARSRCARPPS